MRRTNKITNPDTQTQSLCPVCLKVLTADFKETQHGLLMEIYCPEHGSRSAIVCSDTKTYQKIRQVQRKVTKPIKYGTRSNKGCPYDCGLCSEHDQHTCLAILEITSRCDLTCPICLNSSTKNGCDLKLDKIEAALKELISCEGGVTPLQLSGGEPTLHPDLTDIIKGARSLGFTKTELNTNGLLLGRDRFFVEKLKDAGLTGVYLQFDSLEEKANRIIRGDDLLDAKIRCIENCLKTGLQVVLSVTVVPGINDDQLWQIVEFGIKQGLTGVNFQAIALSGRYPDLFNKSPARLTLDQFIHAIENQSAGKLFASDISPIPCPDPRCGAVAYILIKGGELFPLNRIIEGGVPREQLADLCDWDTMIKNVDWQTRNACACRQDHGNACCEYDDLIVNSSFFSIGFHGMMDRFNFDLERVKRCCVHALDAEGNRIPFCLYNIRRG